jgi:hypothetical protein
VAKSSELTVKVTDLSDTRHVVDVSGAFTDKTALALLAAAMEIFIKTSGLGFDGAVRELSDVLDQSAPVFDPSDITVTQ